MARIVQRLLGLGYFPIDADLLVEGKTIDFDIYIKRFNDFVVIIEAGTTITEALLEKVCKHPKIYVSNAQRDAFRSYCSEHHTILDDDDEPSEDPLQKPLEACESLPGIVQSDMPRHEQIETVYRIACEIMEYYYESGIHALPLTGAETVLEALMKIVKRYNCLSCFTEVMQSRYSVQSHAVNVSIFAIFLGRALNKSAIDLKALGLAALLHDVGKSSVDKKILEKDDTLEPDEFERVKNHATASMEISKKYGLNDERVLQAILYHHEKLDGSGYPEGLKGVHIPEFAQIVGICDAFDALTTERTFRAAYSSFDALRLMKKDMSKQFNAIYIDTFIGILH